MGKTRATSLPIPYAAPVTMATFPFKENKSDMIILLLIPFNIIWVLFIKPLDPQITMLRFLVLPKLFRG